MAFVLFRENTLVTAFGVGMMFRGIFCVDFYRVENLKCAEGGRTRGDSWHRREPDILHDVAGLFCNVAGL